MLNEHLEHHVSQLLLAHDDLSSQRITVLANNGNIVLAGRVQSFRRKLAAQEVAAADANVATVVNELIVDPPCDQTDTETALKVNETLDKATDLSSPSIRVDANSGTVTLTGYVGTELKKLRAADIAASIDKVQSINNLLVVNPVQVATNQKHVRTILQSVSNIIGMENEQIRISLVNETARLSGSVDSEWKKEKVETVVCQFGVLNVANDITVEAKET
jgi:hyperosmotically inducible protein